MHLKTQFGAFRFAPRLLYTRLAQSACDVKDSNFQAPVATWRVSATDSNVASAVTEKHQPWEIATI